jgi:hypothetical protein
MTGEQADKSLMRAMGGAFAVIGTLMDRAGIARIDEFADALAIYATVSAETDNDQGVILGYWASILQEVAVCRRPSDTALS